MKLIVTINVMDFYNENKENNNNDNNMYYGVSKNHTFLKNRLNLQTNLATMDVQKQGKSCNKKNIKKEQKNQKKTDHDCQNKNKNKNKNEKSNTNNMFGGRWWQQQPLLLLWSSPNKNKIINTLCQFKEPKTNHQTLTNKNQNDGKNQHCKNINNMSVNIHPAILKVIYFCCNDKKSLKKPKKKQKQQ